MTNTQVLDIESTLTRLNGDQEFLTALLQVFIDDLPAKLSNLDAAIQADDAKSVSRHAHSLKGACATIGAQQLHHGAFELETAARHEDFSTIHSTFPKVKDQADQLASRIQIELS